ncbi:hypothetical protein T484DRAFT_1752515 [Baffinella frigidus]|nr:hypothetical protein T484DRAFT_1752515 [Cryptophyta sp. CCMP2293]
MAAEATHETRNTKRETPNTKHQTRKHHKHETRNPRPRRPRPRRTGDVHPRSTEPETRNHESNPKPEATPLVVEGFMVHGPRRSTVRGVNPKPETTCTSRETRNAKHHPRNTKHEERNTKHETLASIP